MNVDMIKCIVERIDRLPYQVILFDGVWGIGKSYTIDDALKNNNDVCKISVFGMQDAKQIYHEVLFSTLLENKKYKNIISNVKKIVKNITSIVEEKLPVTKEVLGNILHDKDLYRFMIEKIDKPYIIVIDDLERMSSNVSLEEVFGIVEELRKCKFVKIIFVCNLAELEPKDIYDKYNEKVIDKIYTITESSQKIHWDELGIEEKFGSEFLMCHRIKNLRTLKKAQLFYDEIKTYCDDINDAAFMNEIRWICFAIVVESIENFYFLDKKDTDNKNAQEAVELNNIIENRINRYLTQLKSESSLVTLIFQYYNNKSYVDKESIRHEYELYLCAGDKPNFCKTDQEIKELLPDLRAKIENTHDPDEIEDIVDDYFIFCDLMGIDSTTTLEKYRSNHRDFMLLAAMNGSDLELTDFDYVQHSNTYLMVYEEDKTLVKKKLIEQMIDYIVDHTKTKTAEKYAWDLRRYYEKETYREYIESEIERMYDKRFFPIGNIDSGRYSICRDIMFILWCNNRERFIKYCNELKEQSDRMSGYRIDLIIKKMEEGS